MAARDGSKGIELVCSNGNRPHGLQLQDTRTFSGEKRPACVVSPLRQMTGWTVEVAGRFSVTGNQDFSNGVSGQRAGSRSGERSYVPVRQGMPATSVYNSGAWYVRKPEYNRRGIGLQPLSPLETESYVS